MNTHLLTTFVALIAASAAVNADTTRDRIPPSIVIPAGEFESVLPPAPQLKTVTLQAFRFDTTPVTNEAFLRFVSAQLEWRRDNVAPVFADPGYLSHWPSATQLHPQQGKQPVVHVSWFAASAYCESRGARLPTWHEWEYVSAASATSPNGRNDEQWRQETLSAHLKAGRAALPDVGRSKPNYYGVRDLHGVVWEWVDDLGSMLVSADNREQSDPDTSRFCGPGALTMEQKENYATLMRIAVLSSMQARYTSATMGFRCVTDMRAAK